MESRHDRFWAAFLGVTPSDWDVPGVSVRPHAGLAGYRGLWCFRRQARTVVSAPSGWVPHLTRILEGCDRDLLMDADDLRELLQPDFEGSVGPTFHGAIETGRFRPASGTPVRLVRPDDAGAVNEFRMACGPGDWDLSGLDEAKRHVTACFVDRRVVAMAGYRSWSDDAGDPCGLAHPEFRRRGYGTAVVSTVVQRALAEGKILLYQTLQANEAAVRIAVKLGYDHYASHVAVRLKRDSPEG